MHFYMFHPAKFNFETKHLSRLERAIYREMIDDYMANESPFIADNQKLGWRFECNTEEERNALGTILDNFFVIKKDKKGTEYYHHKRLDAEIRAYRWGNKENFGTEGGTDKGTVAERNGTPKGTDKERKERYKQERLSMINALTENGLTIDKSISMADLRALYKTNFEQHGTEQGTPSEQSGTDRNAGNTQTFDVEPLPVTSNQEPVINISFDDFWNAYDKKRGDTEKIKKKWESLKDSEREAIMSHIPLYKQSQPDKKFRKDPSTYLNNKSWNDEIIYSTGNQYANHQPTFAPTQQQSSHETYSNNLMAELERELAKHGNQCPPNDGYCGNVYDMEAPV